MMKRQTLRGLCCLFAITWIGCGSSKFSEQFAPEIERDCTETFACSTSQFMGAGDVDGCVSKTGEILDESTAATQQLFVDTVERCSMNNQCPYVTCTQADPTVGYAATHQVQITFDCQQRIGCRVASGQTNSANAVADCIGTTSAALNADTGQQAAFDLKYTHCKDFMGCSYNTCQ
jgi:hypothetical protein